MKVCDVYANHAALIGTSVRVRVRRDQTYVGGVLYSIDPESGDVALLVPPIDSVTAQDGVGVKIVLGHSIDAVEADLDNAATTIETIARSIKSHPSYDSNELTDDPDHTARQLSVFLESRFIPHEPPVKGAVAIFGGAATLRFPFQPTDVECSNEQIYQRLQLLLTEFQQSHK